MTVNADVGGKWETINQIGVAASAHIISFIIQKFY